MTAYFVKTARNRFVAIKDVQPASASGPYGQRFDEMA
jgi:hypothetical protein